MHQKRALLEFLCNNMSTQFKIEINDFLGGFCPTYWTSDYPSYGNKNMAGKMLNIDLTNPKYLTQGPGLATLTDGDETKNVSTLIKGIMDFVPTNGIIYGAGGDKVYKISPTAVLEEKNGETTIFPHTITKMGRSNFDAQDVVYYKGSIYYIYNDNAGGGIGKYNTTTKEFDDDWNSTVPEGKAELQGNVPRPMIVAGNDVMYFGNQYHLGQWDGYAFVRDTLDLPYDCVIQDLAWNANLLFIAVNRPNVPGDNKNVASVYVWNGNDPTWSDEIVVPGEISAIHIKNNQLFVFWRDISGKSRLAIQNGTILQDIALFNGNLPKHYQVTEYKNFILWVSDESIYAWGSADPQLQPMMFQLADGGYSTVGGLATPFGVPFVASTQTVKVDSEETTYYKLAKFSNYDTNSYWYSLEFSPLGELLEEDVVITEVLVRFETLKTGAKCNVKLDFDEGKKNWTGSISYTGNGAVNKKKFFPNRHCSSFRVEFKFAEGSTTNPVKIKNIIIYGQVN